MQSCTERGGTTPDSPVRLHIPRLWPCVELQTFSSDLHSVQLQDDYIWIAFASGGEGSTIWCSTTPICFKRNWGKLVRRSCALYWIRNCHLLPTSQKRYCPNLLAQYVLLIGLSLPNQDQCRLLRSPYCVCICCVCVCVCVSADRFLLNLVRIWYNWTTPQACYSKFITISSATTTDCKIQREEDISVTYFYVLRWRMATDLSEAHIFAEHKIKR